MANRSSHYSRIAVILGGIFGWRLPVPDPPPAPVVQAVATPADHTTEAVGRTASRSPIAPAPQEVQKYVPSIQPGDPRDISWPVFVIPLALLIACLAGLTLYRLRAAVHQVRDTRGFQDALRAWTPLVHSHRSTPRAMKRFANRIRYLAMLHQAEHLDESGFDTLRRRCNLMIAWIGGRILRINVQIPLTDPIGAQDRANLNMAEENLVALGALNECFGAQWRSCATGIYDSEKQQEAIEGVLRRLKLTGCSSLWPPSQEELDAFAVSLRGIRAPAV